MNRVSLNEIYTFCNGTPITKNMVEGENILNSGHLIHCGYTNKDDANINLFAMCLQTSALRDKPHEVYGTLSFQNEITWIVSQIVCSCKAGASQTCKHIVATLLHINRSGINILEEVSQTDLKCTWNQKKPALQLYAPKPLKEHSYFNKRKYLIQ
ncbi:unnamed protein product [Macrosiphum euphorbiae]|uniref:SWIM-type domain-containing protein n=1 Tax=Macrosiphum euphorbiae TaxID=13131 RepID=A0AAV0VJ82_9HEMI|nr:unnamed protein product [Macrosiphum euphorbiae]